MKKLFWRFLVFMFYPFNSLKSFKIFCIKHEGCTETEWEEMEKYIMEHKPLRKIFNLE